MAFWLAKMKALSTMLLQLAIGVVLLVLLALMLEEFSTQRVKLCLKVKNSEVLHFQTMVKFIIVLSLVQSLRQIKQLELLFQIADFLKFAQRFFLTQVQ